MRIDACRDRECNCISYNCANSTANASTLGELLEVPQLMEACLRNGSYDEVLDLKAFVAKLGFMHG